MTRIGRPVCQVCGKPMKKNGIDQRGRQMWYCGDKRMDFYCSRTTTDYDATRHIGSTRAVAIQREELEALWGRYTIQRIGRMLHRGPEVVRRYAALYGLREIAAPTERVAMGEDDIPVMRAAARQRLSEAQGINGYWLTARGTV